MERIELARRLGASGAAPAALLPAVIGESQPGRFMAALARAAASGGTVFVADPSRGARERDRPGRLPDGGADGSVPAGETGWLCLPTGGTGGRLRWARHDQDTLAAAVGGFCAHFGIQIVDAIGVLPLHHVSGLMAWIRCALTGGRYVPWAWADLEAGRWPEAGGDGGFLSLVPTQLERLLGRAGSEDRLRRFRAVLLGGGPVWPDLLDRACEARLPLAPGYGMTETAAMVAALRPEEFLAGRRGCGRALPHARLALDGDGRIRIASASLFRGYFPGWREGAEPWPTEDAGRFDGDGGLHVLGRRDAVVISGGEKIEPSGVEAALRATGQFKDVAVVGVPDREWGEIVVACFPAGSRPPDLARVSDRLARELAPHERPKRYLAIPWPRNAQGKINRAALAAAAAQRIADAADSL